MINDQTYENFSVATDRQGIVTVTLDIPGRALNILTQRVMSELDSIVSDLERTSGIKVVVFRSGKESGFLAGADVAVIASIDSPEEASDLIQAGQTLFARIEKLPVPTIAVIHGPCLGGGLEWSLACNRRIARDNSSTKIGLPEIQLGLIPGWGGTQRLPRLIGASNALKLILTGKHLSAEEAAEVGLVDLAIPPDRWQQDVDRFIEAVAKHELIPSSKRSLMRRLMDDTWVGRVLVFASAERSIRAKRNDYPALGAAIRAVKIGQSDSDGMGYATEREEFTRLLSTPTSQNLLDLFLNRERARSLSTWSGDTTSAFHRDPIRRVGVVGAGAMGAGIGQLAATRGYDVVLKEIDEATARSGQARIQKLVDDLARRKQFTTIERKRLLDKISVRFDDRALADCDLVVEAVVEIEDVKAKIFAQLDAVVQSQAILTSNTSSLSISKMADATHRATQVAGLHFFNPVHRMELVEVVRGRDTDDATIARLIGFVKTLGKTPIVTSDAPGFLVNRVLFPYLGEAVLMVGEGHDVAALDRQVRVFGMPMGPLELLDQVGMDVAAHVAGSLRGVLTDVQPVVDILDQMVREGRLGRKSDRGFYGYRRGKRGAALPPIGSLDRSRSLSMHEGGDDGLTQITRRLIYPMFIEAVRCHEQSIVATAWAIDLAMVLGTGFAPHRGGPLHMLDAIGFDEFLQNLRHLEDQFGSRFAAPQELIEMARTRQTYFSRHQCGEVVAVK